MTDLPDGRVFLSSLLVVSSVSPRLSSQNPDLGKLPFLESTNRLPLGNVYVLVEGAAGMSVMRSPSVLVPRAPSQNTCFFWSGCRLLPSPAGAGKKTYSTGVDMWSVGCIFGELIKGSPLFQVGICSPRLRPSVTGWRGWGGGLRVPMATAVDVWRRTLAAVFLETGSIARDSDCVSGGVI